MTGVRICEVLLYMYTYTYFLRNSLFSLATSSKRAYNVHIITTNTGEKNQSGSPTKNLYEFRHTDMYNVQYLHVYKYNICIYIHDTEKEASRGKLCTCTSRAEQ